MESFAFFIEAGIVLVWGANIAGDKMKKYRTTLMGIALSMVLYGGSIWADVDVFETMVNFFRLFEAYEADELAVSIGIVMCCFSWDVRRRQKAQQVELEKLRIYRAMLASTHHILNNCLNQIQLFQMTAEETPGFDAEVLSLFSETVEDAARQVDALGSITRIDEAAIHASVAPKST